MLKIIRKPYTLIYMDLEEEEGSQISSVKVTTHCRVTIEYVTSNIMSLFTSLSHIFCLWKMISHFFFSCEVLKLYFPHVWRWRVVAGRAWGPSLVWAATTRVTFSHGSLTHPTLPPPTYTGTPTSSSKFTLNIETFKPVSLQSASVLP